LWDKVEAIGKSDSGKSGGNGTALTFFGIGHRRDV
jgi:hypothetical protein